MVAYMKTLYKCLEPRFVLNIGVANAALDRLLEAGNRNNLCILTAYNPVSEIQTRRKNQNLQQNLIADLGKNGFSYVNGVNCDPEAKFPDEPTCWVLGMSESEGKLMAVKYNQNALVYCRKGGEPALIWVK